MTINLDAFGHRHAAKPRSVVNPDVLGMSCSRSTANNDGFTPHPLGKMANEGDGV